MVSCAALRELLGVSCSSVGRIALLSAMSHGLALALLQRLGCAVCIPAWFFCTVCVSLWGSRGGATCNHVHGALAYFTPCFLSLTCTAVCVSTTAFPCTVHSRVYTLGFSLFFSWERILQKKTNFISLPGFFSYRLSLVLVNSNELIENH